MTIVQRITNWYFTKDAFPYWTVLVLDCICVMFSGYVGNYYDIGGLEFAQQFWFVTNGNLITTLLFCIGFRLFHTYIGVLRYSSIIDLERVGMAAILGTVLSALTGYVFAIYGIEGIVFHQMAGNITLLTCSVFLMWIVRMTVRMIYDSLKTGESVNIAIYGTQAGGVSLAHSILSSHDRQFDLKAFISDDPKLDKVYILGKPVLANDNDIAQKLIELNIKNLLVSPLKSEMFRENKGMINSITAHGIKIMMMPSAEEWDGKSELTHSQLHEVQIEDLLAREKIEVDMEAIGQLLNGKCILITGAAGSIGSEMVRQICEYRPSKLILIDQAETPMHNMRLMMAKKFAYIPCETIVASITDTTHMEKIFSVHRPEYVFHAAAYKHVPMMEDNPSQAVHNNIKGTRVIADLAVKYSTKKFVMISTDKAVNPTNVMGCSKRICEIYCQSLNKAIQDKTLDLKVLNLKPDFVPITQFVTTRFGNVLGSNGSVIPIFRE